MTGSESGTGILETSHDGVAFDGCWGSVSERVSVAEDHEVDGRRVSAAVDASAKGKEALKDEVAESETIGSEPDSG